MRQLELNQKELESLILIGRVQKAFEEFQTDWRLYVDASAATPSIADNDSNRRNFDQLQYESREIYENSIRSLEALIDANKQTPDSWAEFMKIVYKENRLAFVFLFIWGVATFLVLITIFYRKKAPKD